MDAFTPFRNIKPRLKLLRLIFLLAGAVIVGLSGWYVSVMRTRPCGGAAGAPWHLRIRENNMGGWRWAWSISPNRSDPDAEQRFLGCLTDRGWRVTRPYDSDLVSADRGNDSIGNSNGQGYVFEDGHYEEM